MNFGQALEAVKSGAKIYREGWNGKGAYSHRDRSVISMTIDHDFA